MSTEFIKPILPEYDQHNALVLLPETHIESSYGVSFATVLEHLRQVHQILDNTDITVPLTAEKIVTEGREYVSVEGQAQGQVSGLYWKANLAGLQFSSGNEKFPTGAVSLVSVFEEKDLPSPLVIVTDFAGLNCVMQILIIKGLTYSDVVSRYREGGGKGFKKDEYWKYEKVNMKYGVVTSGTEYIKDNEILPNRQGA